MRLFGFECGITEGNQGYYIDFQVDKLHQEHWMIGDRIRQKLHVADYPSPGKVTWEYYLNKFHLNKNVHFEGLLFPEFEDYSNVMKFFHCLTFMAGDTHFINLRYFLNI